MSEVLEWDGWVLLTVGELDAAAIDVGFYGGLPPVPGPGHILLGAMESPDRGWAHHQRNLWAYHEDVWALVKGGRFWLTTARALRAGCGAPPDTPTSETDARSHANVIPLS